MKARLDGGDVGWLGLIAYITLYDIWAWRTGRSTMSICFGRWCTRRSGQAALALIWGITTTHLFIGRPRWWHLPERTIDGTN